MRRPAVEVPATTTLRDVVDHHVLTQNVRSVPVVSDHTHLVGVVTVERVRDFPRDEWPTTTAADAMVPLTEVPTTTPDESLVQALRDFGSSDLDELPVVDHGDLVGVLSRSDVMSFVQIREDLGGRTRP
jgi:CBS domain-containing protein